MKPPHSIQITAVGSYAPSKVITNDELAELVDTSDEWIKSHTGIAERHIAEKGELTSDLAYKAIEDLFKRSGRNAGEIDGIVVATATPDFPGFPSTACLLAERLGSKGPALDVSAGCTGFIYALETARALIAVGTMKNALVVGAEKLSDVINWEDRNTCVLFGDGAGCVLLEANEEGIGIQDSLLKAEAAGSASLTIDPKEKHITMDGRSVYSFAVRTIGETIITLAERNNLKLTELDWIVPHQANQRIIAACAKRYGIDQDRFYLNIERYANTSAASIPLALSEMQHKGLLKEGQSVLLVGFGAGLTYGGTLLTWHQS
ncbi:MAG: beta-ketoacyl-ACP synthase III [Sphaerochaeta sp.]|uniref:beta-ketoacyl-ACP synthase III n=1 Tax=Sphaerochaeta sp. TaxID=1972642 RepID=UPI002AA6DDCB|nr:beta-ketoacyl-ACP synthase III [uncultured Sphaerochaeta sp.]